MTQPYPSLLEQLRQSSHAADDRHNQRLAEMASALALSGSCLRTRWQPFTPPCCSAKARSNLQRWHRFLDNPRVSAERLLNPLLRRWLGQRRCVQLALDTSIIANRFCLISVALLIGGRALPLINRVIARPHASVGYAAYRPLLQRARRLFSPKTRICLLADRGFLHRELLAQLQRWHWSWRIRLKSTTRVQRGFGSTTVGKLKPAPGTARLLKANDLLGLPGGIALGTLEDDNQTSWAVATDNIPTVSTLFDYAKRFGIEHLFRDCKSGQFELEKTRLNDPRHLERFMMVLTLAIWVLTLQGKAVCNRRLRHLVDAHTQRGSSLLRIGRDWLLSLLLHPERPFFALEPWHGPPPERGFASRQEQLGHYERVSFSSVQLG